MGKIITLNPNPLIKDKIKELDKSLIKLASSPICPICQGEGWIEVIERTNSDGNLNSYSLVRCECYQLLQKQRKLASLLKHSSGSQRALSYILDEDRREEDETFLQPIWRYLEEFPSHAKRGEGVLFVEASEEASQLAGGMLRWLIQRGVEGVWIGMRGLAEGFKGDKVVKKELSLLLKEVRLLVIDGLETLGKPLKDRLIAILDTRHGDLKPTIITTPLQLKEFEDLLGSKIGSKLARTNMILKLNRKEERRYALSSL